jgi:hypothetical protein
MTSIQAKALQKSVRYIMNPQGEKTDIVFSLNDKNVQGFFEDFFDLLVSTERHSEEGIPLEKFKEEFYKRKSVSV